MIKSLIQKLRSDSTLMNLKYSLWFDGFGNHKSKMAKENENWYSGDGKVNAREGSQWFSRFQRICKDLCVFEVL